MADAIPILSMDGECHVHGEMGDDPILADPLVYDSSRSQRRHHHAPPPLFPRRKRPHTGNSKSSSVSSSNAALFVSAGPTRRRGSSVPCDLRTRDDEQQHFPVETRARAGSAGPPHVRGSGHLKENEDGRPISRRRAMSGLLKPFRRRKEAELAASLHNAAAHRPKRRVTFKTTLHADVMPSPWGYQASYDELLFSVGGLYQTLSYLHDPIETEDSTDKDHSHHSSNEAPPERSMLLMIAEFLYRSGVYLGYVTEEGDDCKPWIPGFRESKRFSINDVKRWRRLAHHDWEKEEREFAKHAAHVRQLETKSKEKSGGLRATVSHWIHRRRRHSAPAKLASTTLPFPPPVPKTRDLSLLVTIANSCVSCGAFQFTAKDILQLCNVDIETKLANMYRILGGTLLVGFGVIPVDLAQNYAHIVRLSRQSNFLRTKYARDQSNRFDPTNLLPFAFDLLNKTQGLNSLQTLCFAQSDRCHVSMASQKELNRLQSLTRADKLSIMAKFSQIMSHSTHSSRTVVPVQPAAVPEPPSVSESRVDPASIVSEASRQLHMSEDLAVVDSQVLSGHEGLDDGETAQRRDQHPHLRRLRDAESRVRPRRDQAPFRGVRDLPARA
ncbi:hypothetical protein FI667_g6766, partial [Globisporangium splendens]